MEIIDVDIVVELYFADGTVQQIRNCPDSVISNIVDLTLQGVDFTYHFITAVL